MRVFISSLVVALLLAVPAYAADGGAYSGDIFAARDCGGEVEEAVAAPEVFAPDVQLGGSDWELYYENNVELGPFMARLHTVLSSEEYLGQYEIALFIADYLDAVGAFNHDSMHCKALISGDDMHYSYYKDFVGLTDEQYLGKLLAIPNAELRSADYVDIDDALLFLALTNMVDQMALEVEFMKEHGDLMSRHPLLAAEGVGEDEFAQVFAMLEMMKIEEILRSTLNGEVALAIYDIPSVEQFASGNIGPADFDAVVMIGIDDREYVETMLTNFGPEVGLMPVDVPEHMDWSYYQLAMEESIGILFNDEIILASPNVPALLEHLHSDDLGFDAPATQFYFDLNVQKLHDELLHPGLQFALGMAGESEIVVPHDAVFYLLDVPDSSALGHFTVNAYFDDGVGMGMNVDAKKAVITYELAYLAMGVCAFAQAADIDLDDLDLNF